MTASTKITYPADLPITDRREELLATIADHQVVIVAGETGSGKSTQLPKMCLELGRGAEGRIGHTQPRRLAARTIADRVAKELGGRVGDLVGYKIRFSDQVGEHTRIKLMTDGILLAEIHHDRLLRKYDTIILDEAHERSLNVDFLLGYLATVLPRRQDLKLIVTSATIDTERFSQHFGDAPVIEVSGRTYPVEMRYRPLDDPAAPEPRDQPQGICDAVLELVGEGPGDILVFCSGEREIRDAADAIADLDLRHTEVLPLYARLSAAEQQRVFQPHTGRRIVLATNVAETSLTVPGIRYVIDPGTARISRYSRRTKVQQLPIEPISQASANQRAGRCGRLGPGVCIRLYAEDDFLSRPEFTEPEIQRTSLASVILQMAALDLGDIETFPFLDPPDHRAIRDGIALLEELGAVDPERRGTARWLTKLGRRLARIPLDPRLGRMLIEAGRNACLREVAVIAAALSIQDPRERPQDQQERADQLHARFRHEESDFLGWLRLWAYIHEERRARTSSGFRRLCREEFLNYRRIREWQDVHRQLREIAGELGITPNRKPADADVIHLTLLAGLLSHVGKKDPDGYEYRGARGARFSISPGSALFKRAPEWVMAGELVETTRLWARQVAPITPDWIERLGRHVVKRSYSDPWWDARRGSAVARETVTLYGLPLVTDRIVQFGRIEPAAARQLFIEHALVSGEWDTHHTFARRNEERIDEVLALEARQRRADLLVGDDRLFAFFDARIPPDVVSVAHFDRWWRDQVAKTPHLLDLRVDDLIDPAAAPPDDEAFPEVWTHGVLDLPLDYEFDPGSPDDGVTVVIPVGRLDLVDPAMFEWNVPGLRRELIEALVRSLPKALRKRFVPIPDTAAEVLERVDPSVGRLVPALRRELTRIGGVTIPPDAFDLDAIPPHLRPRYRIVGDDGEVLADGDDLETLKSALLEQARATMADSAHPIERTGITSWDFGELPDRLEVGDGSASATAYPAIVDEGDSVSIRLLATRRQQAEAMWEGVRRLVRLALPSHERGLRVLLTPEGRRVVGAGSYGGIDAWADDCLTAAIDDLMTEAGGVVWNAAGFDRLVGLVGERLPDRVVEVATASLEIMALAEDVAGRLDRMRAERYADSVDDMLKGLERLVYPGFVRLVGAHRLDDIRRYVTAIDMRLDRLGEHTARDLELMDRIHRLEAHHDALVEALGPTTELIDVAWLLEELRVSFFAQALGTKGKVSEKRVVQALERAAG